MSGRQESRGPDLSALRIDERARGGRRINVRAVIFVLAVLVVLAVVAAVVFLRGRSVVVEVVAVGGAAQAKASALLNASGYVTPRRRATIAAKITGRVNEIFADEGMVVATGQVLATLDDAEARRRLTLARTDRDVASAAIADLEVNRANAQRELKRAQELQVADVGSVQTVDLARAARDSLEARLALQREQVRAADAAIAIAQQDVDNCTVRAPFAGIVVSKDAQRGEMVSPISAGGGFTRTGIATIVDMQSLEIEVDINESSIAKVAPAQRVEATLDAYPDWRIPAKVRTVIPTADRQKATVKVRISFDALDPRILPDMGVKVAFLGDEKSGAAPVAKAVVPLEAVRQEGGRPVVYVLRDGRLERRAVQLGAARGAEQELTAGAAEGDQVVIRPAEGLRDGQRARLK